MTRQLDNDCTVKLRVSEALAQEVWSQAETAPDSVYARIFDNPKKTIMITNDEAENVLDWACTMIRDIACGGLDLDGYELPIGNIWRGVRRQLEAQGVTLKKVTA